MFTGIIEAVGVVGAVEAHGADRRLRIDAPLLAETPPAIGDSVCVNGVCLTATELAPSGFHADVSVETLACTTLADLGAGDRVNLERALTPSTPLGGHLVSGHVDGTGRVLTRHDEARSVRFTFSAPATLARYIAVKGSICVDGVSLTVNAVQADGFAVNIVPHTLEATTFGEFAPGRRVNLEVDLIARYLERLLDARGLDGA
ncbi:MAG: riboflavin synthase [Gammaproteobacteria bacterium]|nr:riboflavin synthase [Gammaproteobacteria bacterium]NIM73536.1 riboflavin synthase [Gammaproteobacteria bacterium]NIN39945.1 riboflavin synthase [Gammaproteobacteria bacterium]NIO25345.1 riboflavin synthase [Gammaproteobacteria bacterium]NIO65972.1 riboflavin synthase [Gammaproteobacteria bacterium]